MELNPERVLAWRMRRQLLGRPPGTTTLDVVERLCGVQAQVSGSAEQAVAARHAQPRAGLVAEALHERAIVKTWAMRGTLHLLPAGSAPAYLALIAAARTWERGPWQRTFATAGQMAALTEVAREVLDGVVLTREELSAEIIRRTRDDSLAEHLTSGWGALFKPVAWQGYLINGPADGNRVTFTSPETWVPGWAGLPEPEEAARVVIPAYLGAFGPASLERFDQWLIRGASRKAALRGWFAGLVRDGVLAEVTVDGQTGYARAGDVAEIAAAEPLEGVRLLPAFDQYVLGPGTKDPMIIDPGRRAAISRTAGWIAPVLLAGGRVAGTWELNGTRLDVTPFPDAPRVSAADLQAEAGWIEAVTGAALTVKVP
jgi:winged helix DNA-binding protein